MELIKLLRDMVCFTIPESIFMTIMTYILLKRFDLLDRYNMKNTLKSILIPSVVSSFVMMLLYYFKLLIICDIFGLLTFYILIFNIVKKNTYTSHVKLFFKVLGYFLLSNIIILGIETICMVIISIVLKMSFESLFNMPNNFLLLLVTSSCWIMLDSVIIALLYTRRNNKFVTTVQIILKNKDLLYIFLSIIITMLFVIILFINLVLNNNIFVNVSIYGQVLITLSMVCIIPSLIMLFLSKIIVFLINKEKHIQQLYQDSDII